MRSDQFPTSSTALPTRRWSGRKLLIGVMAVFLVIILAVMARLLFAMLDTKLIWVFYLGASIGLLQNHIKRSRALWRRLNVLSDWLALERFNQSYSHPDLNGVTVIIPAYNEAATLRQTLNAIPSTVCGLPVHTLVISDGSDDDTPIVATQRQAYVCHSPLQRGQGAALRLGYHLALRHRSRYVVTLDADGQYIPSEMEILLRPLLDGEADFTQGSRRLGTYELESRLRIMGMFLFGWVIRLLTRHSITDSSNGFRAIRTDILDHLTLLEDQYHASELLIGSILKGYRVVERPITMLRRQAGTSKKGRSLVYGWHYARVIVGTWLRGG